MPKIVHAEVVGKDGPAIHTFYDGVFGWKQNTDLPGGCAMTDPADSGIILGSLAPCSPSGRLRDSIDDATAKAACRSTS